MAGIADSELTDEMWDSISSGAKKAAKATNEATEATKNYDA
jgi:hypothetical protein